MPGSTVVFESLPAAFAAFQEWSAWWTLLGTPEAPAPPAHWRSGASHEWHSLAWFCAPPGYPLESPWLSFRPIVIQDAPRLVFIPHSSPLVDAASAGDVPRFEALLALGADPEEEFDGSPLLWNMVATAFLPEGSAALAFENVEIRFCSMLSFAKRLRRLRP